MTTTKPLRIVVAANPSAAFGRGAPVGPTVVDALARAGHDVTSLTRSSYGDLLDAASAALALGTARQADALVVVGGDGMVSLGTGLVAQTGVGLGLVPAGTGNDMARMLGVAHDDPVAATASLVGALAAPARLIDALLVTHATGATTWVAGTVSAGFDAFVNERANGLRRPRGRLRYDVALLLELVRVRQVDYELVVDGAPERVAGTLVSVGNARSVGGGIALLPDAVVDDGELDVLVVDRLSRRTFLRLFPRVAKGTHGTDPRVRLSRARKVRVSAPGVIAYGDGERLGPLPLEIEVVPGALAVYA
jgi:diacylglycerol kinase (ATP)